MKYGYLVWYLERIHIMQITPYPLKIVLTSEADLYLSYNNSKRKNITISINVE